MLLGRCVCTFYTFGSNLYTCILYILKLTFTLFQCKFTFFIPKTCCIISYCFSPEWNWFDCLSPMSDLIEKLLCHYLDTYNSLTNESILIDKIPKYGGLLVAEYVDIAYSRYKLLELGFFRVLASRWSGPVLVLTQTCIVTVKYAFDT